MLIPEYRKTFAMHWFCYPSCLPRYQCLDNATPMVGKCNHWLTGIYFYSSVPEDLGCQIYISTVSVPPLIATAIFQLLTTIKSDPILVIK